VLPIATTNNKRIACFFATSGHSGVDRAMKHLIPALLDRGYFVDLLHVRRHGPYIEQKHERLRIVDLGSKHVYPSLMAVVRYLKTERPAVMLSDKDRVNRTALLAKYIAGGDTRLVLSSGTTISIDLATRGAFERWLQRTSMGKLYGYASQVIVTSKGVADDMAGYTGLARGKISVVPSPVVPASCFEEQLPRPDHSWFKKGEPPVILGVGELCMRKDFQTLLRAFAKVRAQQPCRLVILGKGRQREELGQLATELGVGDDVDFAGFQPNPYAFMQHAALFAFTSKWEGLGFVIIEALAVGTPVVSTDCPSGPSEILQDGHYGRLVAVSDVDGLASSIVKTLDNPLSSDILKQAARPYEIEASTDAYLEALGLPKVCP